VLGTVKGWTGRYGNGGHWSSYLPDGTSTSGWCSTRQDAAWDLQYHRDRLDRELAAEQAALEGAA